MELNLKLQSLTGEFTKLQSGQSRPLSLASSLSLPPSLTSLSADYSKAVENRQLLDAQKSENEGVKKVCSSRSFLGRSTPCSDL